MKLFPWERRTSFRYQLPLLLTVEARWNGRALLLERVQALENISAGGLYFSLAANSSPSLPENAELDIRFPLTESLFHPARLHARCRGRVVRCDPPNRVAVEFEEVEFLREERPTRLPVPLNT